MSEFIKLYAKICALYVPQYKKTIIIIKVKKQRGYHLTIIHVKPPWNCRSELEGVLEIDHRSPCSFHSFIK